MPEAIDADGSSHGSPKNKQARLPTVGPQRDVLASASTTMASKTLSCPKRKQRPKTMQQAILEYRTGEHNGTKQHLESGEFEQVPLGVEQVLILEGGTWRCSFVDRSVELASVGLSHTGCMRSPCESQQAAFQHTQPQCKS